MTDKDLLKMLGLYDKTITLTLEDEILDTMNKFHQDNVEHEKKKKEFLALFKECYDDIVKIIGFDPHKRIAVDCFTCVRGMDLSKQYGKPKKK